VKRRRSHTTTASVPVAFRVGIAGLVGEIEMWLPVPRLPRGVLFLDESMKVLRPKNFTMRTTSPSILLFVFLMGMNARGATLVDEHAAEELATTAMGTLGAKGVRGVFETVAPYWTRSKAELESVISDSEVQRERAAAGYGKYLSFEKISERKVGSSLLMITILEKTEKRGVVWFFSFYKPKDAWILWSCYWDPNFEGLLLLK